MQKKLPFPHCRLPDNGPEERGPGLVVEGDDDAGGRQSVRRPGPPPAGGPAGVRHGAVARQAVARVLVELVPGVGVLARPQRTRGDVRPLVEVRVAVAAAVAVVAGVVVVAVPGEGLEGRLTAARQRGEGFGAIAAQSAAAAAAAAAAASAAAGGDKVGRDHLLLQSQGRVEFLERKRIKRTLTNIALGAPKVVRSTK